MSSTDFFSNALKETGIDQLAQWASHHWPLKVNFMIYGCNTTYLNSDGILQLNKILVLITILASTVFTTIFTTIPLFCFIISFISIISQYKEVSGIVSSRISLFFRWRIELMLGYLSVLLKCHAVIFPTLLSTKRFWIPLTKTEREYGTWVPKKYWHSSWISHYSCMINIGSCGTPLGILWSKLLPKHVTNTFVSYYPGWRVSVLLYN